MSDHAPIDPAKVKRQKRLEDTLKENLRRRKAQARARAGAPADGTQEEAGPGEASDDPPAGPAAP